MEERENEPVPLLEVGGLTKRYGTQTVLAGVDLVLGRGQRLAIMGPSGSGKSTLLNCVAGLEVADRGTIRFEGRELGRKDEAAATQLRRGRITSIFQFFHLLPTLRAWENVEFPLLLAQQPETVRRERTSALLQEVGLTHRSELSGGEMQRLAIARALITEPALILADEPTGSLDSRNSEKILQLLLDLTARHQTALLMVTHDAEAAEICQQVRHMSDGQLLDA